MVIDMENKVSKLGSTSVVVLHYFALMAFGGGSQSVMNLKHFSIFPKKPCQFIDNKEKESLASQDLPHPEMTWCFFKKLHLKGKF